MKRTALFVHCLNLTDGLLPDRDSSERGVTTTVAPLFAYGSDKEQTTKRRGRNAHCASPRIAVSVHSMQSGVVRRAS